MEESLLMDDVRPPALDTLHAIPIVPLSQAVF